MEALINTVNEVQDAFANIKRSVKLNLPQIAVVGSQSCGKSSVLESIVGRDFLPRGSGIVTRCPLVLQLIQLPRTESAEWGEFHHVSGKKFTDFSEIRDEITRRTNEIAGPYDISATPILLKIYSNAVLNLTLIDLPGLVMNAVGDQPKDIDTKIFSMVKKFVDNPTTIILAISPANTDLATSQSLRLASKIDPTGVRTVGVLTKLDLMDKGTNCLDVLENKVFPLRHGYVGVVCRSQQDIKDRTTMDDARKAEREFFENCPDYRHIADTSGTEYLSKKLNTLLLNHIRTTLPQLKQEVDALWVENQKQMEQLGMLDDANFDPGAQLLKVIKDFSDAVNKTIDGGVTDATKEVLGGARLNYIFHECFASYVYALNATKELTDDYIRINAHNMSGMHATLFPSDNVFIALVKQQIMRLDDPSQKCIGFILEELQSILTVSSTKADRFPQLKEEFVRIGREMLMEYKTSTSHHVHTIIKAEHGFINVRHPQMEKLAQDAFFKMYGVKPEESKDPSESSAGSGNDTNDNKNGTKDNSRGEENAKDNKKDNKKDKKDKEKDDKKILKTGGGVIDALANPSSMTDVPSRILLGNTMTTHEKRMYEAIRLMVIGYFDIVKGNIADQVPKAITLLIITRLRDEIYGKLVRSLYTEKKAQDLLAEPPEVRNKRQQASEMKEALSKARQKLNEVSSFMPSGI